MKKARDKAMAGVESFLHRLIYLICLETYFVESICYLQSKYTRFCIVQNDDRKIIGENVEMTWNGECVTIGR